MPVPSSDIIISKINEVEALYHQLILVVGPSSSGKTTVLQNLASQAKLPLININLELSRLLLDLTERQRIMQISRLMGDIVNQNDAKTVLLDNIELLFDPSLKQNPLLLLQGLSRNKTIVAAWNGTVDKNHLIYATPDHPEYRRYPAKDLTIVPL